MEAPGLGGAGPVCPVALLPYLPAFVRSHPPAFLLNPQNTTQPLDTRPPYALYSPIQPAVPGKGQQSALHRERVDDGMRAARFLLLRAAEVRVHVCLLPSDQACVLVSWSSAAESSNGSYEQIKYDVGWISRQRW